MAGTYGIHQMALAASQRAYGIAYGDGGQQQMHPAMIGGYGAVPALAGLQNASFFANPNYGYDGYNASPFQGQPIPQGGGIPQFGGGGSDMLGSLLAALLQRRQARQQEQMQRMQEMQQGMQQLFALMLYAKANGIDLSEMTNMFKGKTGGKGSATSVARTDSGSIAGGKQGKAADVEAVKWGAKQIGVSPEELASVIGFESGFDPNKWGGAGGKYFGLIQFGPDERKHYGIDPKKNWTVAEQMPYVVRFLKDRGFKANEWTDRLERQTALYSTVIAGNPYDWRSKDKFGSSASNKAQSMLNGNLRAQAVAWLGKGGSDDDDDIRVASTNKSNKSGNDSRAEWTRSV